MALIKVSIRNLFFANYLLDVILPYLESAVDSPISSSNCKTTGTQRSGNGDVDVNDLLSDVSRF